MLYSECKRETEIKPLEIFLIAVQMILLLVIRHRKRYKSVLRKRKLLSKISELNSWTDKIQ
ncbi:hypothetical protein BBW68_06630 [Candidatus Erwinia dacicola]|uniref:Uncharacterized protein n=1 Tax=Candidatus Erwinia dacicola TaxID=252393 RepID=A0A1E7Z2X5_9GAMM|nr:hypothetical protein BBW68_06630 [Candidatus Erwinia dacicola]